MPRSIFACTYEDCKAIFRHSERYERHLLKHTGERPFECSYDGCDKRYSCKSHLKRHEQTHEKMFKCTLPGCSQILKTKESLINHQNGFHKRKESAKKYKCPECDEEFIKRCMLARHTYIHSGVKEYKCSEPECDKSFAMPSLLKRHLKRHKGYFCDESDCSEYFSRWSLLLNHRKECHPKIFRCNICEKVFKHSGNLKAHSFTHKLEKDVFRCTIPQCTRVYTSKHILSDHVRTFHSKFTLPCPEANCHRFLSDQEALEKHIQWRHRRRKNKKPKNPPVKKPDFAEILAGFAKGSKKDLNPHQREILRDESDDDVESFVDLTLIGDSKDQDTDCELNSSPNVVQNESVVRDGLNPCTSIEEVSLDHPSSNSKKKSKEDLIENEVSCHSLQNCSQTDEIQSSSRGNYKFGCKVEADISWTSSDMTSNEVN